MPRVQEAEEKIILEFWFQLNRSSYFESTPVNCCAILERGTNWTCNISLLAWSQRNLSLAPTTPVTKPSRGADR